MINSLKLLFDVLRVRQWTKNLFMISPLVFSGHFNQLSAWGHCCWAMFGFCFISSGMYIINDIFDLREDRFHPQKKLRPLAAGRLGILKVRIIAVAVLILGGLICYGQGQDIFCLALFYMLLHFLYNLYTKHVVILDVLTVAFGFIIRVWAGAAAVHVMPSQWIQVCMFALALFLTLTKRRCEIVVLEKNASSHRPVLSCYTTYLLDRMIAVTLILSIVLYGLYTVSMEVTERIHGVTMFYSTIFVVFGIFRYLYLLRVKKNTGDPGEVLLSDIPMMINIVLWLVFVMMVIQKAQAGHV